MAVETRKGGDKWTFELNDPLPEFRWRSWHMVGLRSSTPRVSFGGPVIANRLFILESIQYEMRESPVITLPFPNNESRREGYNSLTAIDYTLNASNIVTATMHVADQHTRFANLDFFNPQPVTPEYFQLNVFGRYYRACGFSRNAPRQRPFRDQLPRRGLAAGRPPHDPDPVPQRGELFQPADPYILPPRMARNVVAREASFGERTTSRSAPWWAALRSTRSLTNIP